jgi:tetratricopeptide (TPR) repeat protein
LGWSEVRKILTPSLIFIVAKMFLCGEVAAAADDVQACLIADHYQNPSADYETCDRALRAENLSKSDRAKLLVGRGEAAYFANRMDLSQADLDEAVALDPDYGNAFLRRGWTRLHLNQRPGALQDFTTLLAMEPDNTAALFAIGYFYSHTTEWESKSLPTFKRVLEINPNDYLTRYNYAELLCCSMARPDQAIAEYDRILKASDTELAKVKLWKLTGRNWFDFKGLVRISRVESFIALSDNESAFKAINGMIEDYPDSAGVYSRRAYLYSISNKHSEALSDSVRAVKLDPYSGPMKRQVVDTLFRLKRYDEGLEKVNAYLKTPLSDASRGDLLFWRGAFLKHLKNPEQALIDMENSFALNPQGLQSMMIQLVQYGYYDGAESDPYSENVRNALQACLIDPRCAS